MSWGEVAQLGLRYGKIPLALLAVEALYWFITQPSDTLALIQVTEAYIWNEVTQLMFGEGASTLSTHNGWLTRIDFYHESFPEFDNRVGLYVSDECAGVHEMLFLTTLIVMTDGVSQKVKLKSVITMCGIVYVLNIIRLVLLYQFAIQGCAENPNADDCAQPMWDFHTMVYEWGFLVVLVLMWLVWFKWAGAGRGIIESETQGWGIGWRKDWNKVSIAVLSLGVLLLLGAVVSIVSDEGAMQAWDENRECQVWSDLDSNICADEEQAWKEEIKDKWAFAGLGMFLSCASLIRIDKPMTYEEE